MEIPETIKVGGFVFKVEIKEELKDDDGETLNGLCDFSKSIIFVANDGEQLMEQAFLHELLHAIDYVYNAYKLGEATTERLSHGIYQVFLDNKIF